MVDERLKQIFLELIRIDGLSFNERNVSNYINNFLLSNNYKPIEDDSKVHSNSNTGNIICKVGSGGNFLLTAHMDTARPTKNVKPQLKEDRITSDGTTVLGVDNRAGIAILLRLLEKINSEDILTKDFSVAFTTCEEITLGGSKHISMNGSTKMAFVFDSYLRPGQFINESYGAASFIISTLGKAAHSGIEPDKGINSLQLAAHAINSLKLGRFDDVTTLNIGKIKGGSAVNVVPEFTELEGEIRSTTTQNVEDCFNFVKNAFTKSAKFYNGKVEFNLNWDFQPYFLDQRTEVVSKISEAIKKVGLKPTPAISRGGSDANSFNERGIPALNIGIGAQNPHSNDEFILYEDFNNAFQIAYELVKK